MSNGIAAVLAETILGWVQGQARPWEGWEMHPMWGMWGAWGFGMMLMMLVFWAVVITGLVLGIARVTPRWTSSASATRAGRSIRTSFSRASGTSEGGWMQRRSLWGQS
jgi:uncharacterized membrane protein